MTDAQGREIVMEHYHQGLHELVNGNCESLKPMWSEKEDVSLGNPFGPFVTGRQQVISTMERATSHYKGGEVVAFEKVAKQTVFTEGKTPEQTAAEILAPENPNQGE